jgi:hypothetical protein
MAGRYPQRLERSILSLPDLRRQPDDQGVDLLRSILRHSTRASRIGSAAGQFNPDEVTVQDMEKALDNPGLGVKVIPKCRGIERSGNHPWFP